MADVRANADPPTPPLPFIPSWRNVKIFLLGAVWALIPATLPAASMIWYDLTNYEGPIDWRQVIHVSAPGLALGAVAYWRKYRALIAPPPDDVQQEKALAQAAAAFGQK